MKSLTSTPGTCGATRTPPTACSTSGSTSDIASGTWTAARPEALHPAAQLQALRHPPDHRDRVRQPARPSGARRPGTGSSPTTSRTATSATRLRRAASTRTRSTRTRTPSGSWSRAWPTRPAVSFQSVNYPTRYLRHYNYNLRLDVNDGTVDLRRRRHVHPRRRPGRLDVVLLPLVQLPDPLHPPQQLPAAHRPDLDDDGAGRTRRSGSATETTAPLGVSDRSPRPCFFRGAGIRARGVRPRGAAVGWRGGATEFAMSYHTCDAERMSKVWQGHVIDGTRFVVPGVGCDAEARAVRGRRGPGSRRAQPGGRRGGRRGLHGRRVAAGAGPSDA